MKQKQPLYTDQEIANFMMTEIMEARNPNISFKICMNVIEDNIKKMESK